MVTTIVALLSSLVKSSALQLAAPIRSFRPMRGEDDDERRRRTKFTSFAAAPFSSILEIDCLGVGDLRGTLAASKCWGRRPCLIRDVFDPDCLMGSVDPCSLSQPWWPSWCDVIEIACDPDSESRMITHVPGDAHSFEINWALSDRWLEKIMTTSNTSKARKETVVVNDVERFFPALCDWSFETFDWIPNWRKDDCQISLAEKGGGIGAHVDNYDVFLIQMQGRRTWQVGNKIMSWAEEDRRTIRDLDVRILDNWDGQEMTELVLKPGDVLYLPPRVAHCGIALTDDCMTLSVGQRAPSVSDMVSRLAEELSTSSEDAATRRYTDKHLLDHGASSDLTPGKLTVDSLERARRLLLNELASMLNDDDWFGDFYGRFVSEQKRLRDHYPFPLEGDEEGDSKFIVRQVFEDRLYVNGQRFETATAAAATTAAALCNNRRIDRKLLLIDGSSRLSSDALALLEELVALGLLYFSEEE